MPSCHEHLAAFSSFLARYDAKDKLTALIQYAAMFAADGEPGTAKTLQTSVAGARKVFRIGNETGPLKSLVMKPGLGRGPLALEVLEKVRLIGMAQYFAGNHVALMGDVGILTDKQLVARGTRSGQWGWCIGSCCGGLIEAYLLAEMLRLPTVSCLWDSADSKGSKRRDELMAEVRSRLLGIVHNSAMVVLALGLLGKLPLRQRTLGAVGVFSALVSCYKLYPAVPVRRQGP